MAFNVVLRPHAEEDLTAIYEYIAQSNPQRAIEYLRRLARMLPFDRSAVIIYRIEGDVVRIINIFYRGRNYEAILRGEAWDNE